LAVSKQGTQKFDRTRLNLRKLYELEVRKQYQIEISNRFAALENLSDRGDINRTWESIKENIKTSGKEN
jgi:hypothetical protein